MARRSRLKALLLFAHYTETTSYYEDWLEAFKDNDELLSIDLNIIRKDSLNKLRRGISLFDIIILLHSTNADNVEYLSPYIKVLNERKCKLIIFLGNEFNSPLYGAGLMDKIYLMNRIEPDYIVTQLPLKSAVELYGDIKNARVLELPPALNPKYFKPTVPHEERKIDIGVRSYTYYPFLGDDERNSILKFFLNTKFGRDIVIDISTDPSRRLTRLEWAKFLNNCKGTVSTEAGSYYLEKNDLTVKRVSRYLKMKLPIWKRLLLELNESRFKNYIRMIFNVLRPTMIHKAKSRLYDINSIYHDVNFQDIYGKFFKNYQNRLSGKCISSRHFDAIGTKTCQVMYYGKFNGILKPDENYIVLNRDFSNINEVLDRLADVEFRSKVVDNTYQYIMDCHTYKHRVAKLLKVLEQND